MRNKYTWLIVILGIATIIIMVLFAQTNLYISEPYDVGFDRFIDIGAGIVFVSLLLIGGIIGIICYRNYSNQKK